MNTLRWIACLMGIGILSSCGATSENASKDIRLNQYLIEGKKIYESHCANCHQADGQGFAKLYPPIDSLFLRDTTATLRIILQGNKNPLTVKGIEYTLPMPGHDFFTDLELAELSTYLYATWSGQEAQLIRTETVKAIRETP